jgi:hypothetical protein
MSYACSEDCGLLSHARALPRHLQDVRADDVIMTYKTCGHVVLRYSAAPLAGMIGRRYDLTDRYHTVDHVQRGGTTRQGTPCAAHNIISLLL